jgi:hypothetical protein
MVCERFQNEGMRLLDGEITEAEKAAYLEHVEQCEHCTAELKDLGRIVELTNEMQLRQPDVTYWDNYWKGIYRRLERGVGFLFMMIGIVGVLLFALYKIVTSPGFLSFPGIAGGLIIVGFIILFLSVVRERYHERKTDPYREVKQ